MVHTQKYANHMDSTPHQASMESQEMELKSDVAAFQLLRYIQYLLATIYSSQMTDFIYNLCHSVHVFHGLLAISIHSIQLHYIIPLLD